MFIAKIVFFKNINMHFFKIITVINPKIIRCAMFYYTKINYKIKDFDIQWNLYNEF